MGAGTQTVVIGLDGVPPWLLDRLIEDGETPFLAQMRETGVFGSMRSSVNRMTASAWPSMFTGVNPGKHGLFNFVQYEPAEQNIFLANSLNRQAGAVWKALAADEKKSAILRVPMTFPTTPVRGIMVGDHFTPSPRHPEFTWPRKLGRRLIRRFGRLGWGRKVDVADLAEPTRARKHLRQLRSGVERSFDLVDYALDEDDFSLIFSVVSETDAALHGLVPLVAPQAAVHDRFPDLGREAGQALFRLFKRIDQRLARLTDRIGADANILIVSDHGMGAKDPGAQLLRPLLVALGYQGWVDPPPPPTAGRGIVPLLRRVKSGIAQHIPWQVRRMIDPISHERREAGARKDMVEVIDWQCTTAFTVVPGGGVGEIWLNLKDRSPDGIVDSLGADALIEELTEVLLSARNARTGEHQIERIVPREEAVNGPHSDVVPDLIVIFRQDQDCTTLRAQGPDGNTVEVDRSSPGGWGIEHFGFHEEDGLLMGAGPDVCSTDDDLSCDIVDVAPTLAYLLGCPVPEELDGELIEDIVDPHLLENQPPVQGDPLPPPPWASEGDHYSDTDQQKVEERLKDLGYI